jgi:hypothetical protein
MTQIHDLKIFQFPYDSHRFAGQATDERILYVTREHPLFLSFRAVALALFALAIFFAAWLFSSAFQNIFAFSSLGAVLPIALIMASLFAAVGWWWVYSLWRKSLAILTNKRLLKIIYTTPFNRYSQSLPLSMIVDSSCNNQGFLAGIAHSTLEIGTLTARSSASSSGVATEDTNRVNKKYFYLENIKYCEDLQQYLNKVLSLVAHSPEKLDKFRPFIPQLKGKVREKFISDYQAKNGTKE